MFDISGRVMMDNSVTTYSGHTNEVLCAQFSFNGALIVSCGMDRTARVYRYYIDFICYYNSVNVNRSSFFGRIIRCG